jgi:hypothetical protein
VVPMPGSQEPMEQMEQGAGAAAAANTPPPLEQRVRRARNTPRKATGSWSGEIVRLDIDDEEICNEEY